MGTIARCPSCGAPVEFKSIASILAVCDYCQSTLLRQGAELENLGKMAALVEDRSPLQRGAEARWNGLHFGLIGRLQLRYEQGLWNEWHLLFDDGKSGWLSEAGGEYVISQPVWVQDTLPGFEQLQVGQRHLIAGRMFTVTNILVAECVAGEGELPFKVGAGYPAPVADLRDEAGGFATFDYSDDPNGNRPLVFIGASVDFKSLGWANLREGMPLPEITAKAKAFACPNCAAPLQVRHEDIATVGCGSCGAVIDTAGDTLQLVSRVSAMLKQPRIPLGTRGKLSGAEVELIGYMKRCMMADGVEYCWSEYVCIAPDRSLTWLTEYDGHWNIARPINRAVRAIGDVRYDNQDFKHFQGYEAKVQFVIGEFPWRVKMDEAAVVDDYVAPPRMLSRERTDNEETWTVSEYVPPAEIVAAFGLKSELPAPRGVYANQPNPHEVRHRAVCRSFWQFIGIALAVHFLIALLGPGGILLQHRLTFEAADEDTVLTPEFRVTSDTPRIEVANETNADNNWVGLDLTLANQETGQVWQTFREVSHYSGVDGGESWSEGSKSDDVYFADVPPGRYVLAINHDMDSNARSIGSTLTIRRSGPRWSSLVVLLLVLLPFPLISRGFHAGFEKKRWADSDHPIVTESDSDD